MKRDAVTTTARLAAGRTLAGVGVVVRVVVRVLDAFAL